MNETLIQRVVEAPAIALDKSVESSIRFSKEIRNQVTVKKAGAYFKNLGPGLITGAADDDPSGIATYSQAGALFGYQLLWLAAFTFPLMAFVQEMCARISLETGRGLAGNIRINFPKWILYTTSFLLFFANTLNLGADIGAMAKSSQLIFPHIHYNLLIVAFTIFSLFLQIFVPYRYYSKYLKYLVFFLFSYIISAFVINLNWRSIIWHTLVPSITFSKQQLFIICAVLGTTISPYLFFWQTSQEVEEKIMKGKTSIRLREGTNSKEIKTMRVDVWSGMFLSNLVMFFIIAVTAGTLFSYGSSGIETAAQAAEALRPIGGEYAYLLFTLGIVGTGLLAVPILAGAASYALSECFLWKYGLYRKLKHAPTFYGVIIISMLIGLLMNFTSINPVKVLIYSSVVNGLISPVILVLIVLISSNKKIMNGRVNNSFTTAVGWFTVILMIVSGIAAIYSLFL